MLTIKNLQKNFGAVKAVKDASLQICEGEIRALLGANGSGKSTLVKVLSGLCKKDGGVIELDGKEVEIKSPVQSCKHGIAMAYQDLSLIPILSVAENMVLGHEPRTKTGAIDKQNMNAYAAQMIEELGINAFPGTKVSRVDLSNQGLIEVAKALYTTPRLLILDEITASMHHDQVKRLFGFLKKQQERGLAILFVSHRFYEVYSFCETATILREGTSVADVTLKENSQEKLVYYMTGQEVDRVKTAEQTHEWEGESLLRVRSMEICGAVDGVSLSIGKGEIVGIAGLQGQGQSEFLRALYGAKHFQSGSVELEGSQIRLKSPAEAIRKGFAFISGDRELEGVFSVRSVAENILIVQNAMKAIFSGLKIKRQKNQAKEIIQILNIVAAGIGVPASSLSGGNQQKLVVGRWLLIKPKVLLLDDPTKGVDVTSRNEINMLLREMTKTGMSVIYSSSDNEELLKVAQRIYVFYEGRIAGELKGSEMNGQLLAATMLGTNARGEE